MTAQASPSQPETFTDRPLERGAARKGTPARFFGRRLSATAVALLLAWIAALAAFVPVLPGGVFPLAVTAGKSAQQEPDPVVARVYFSDPAELVDLTSRLDVWEVNHGEGHLLALIRRDQMQSLSQSGYRVEIDFFRTAQVHRPVEALPQQAGGIPGFSCYRTVEETYTSLSQLAASHPDLMQIVDIGDSWEKQQPGGEPGYDLLALVITNRSIPGPKPAFFLMAEAHAREYATAELATRFAETLGEGYGTDPDITWLLDHFELHLVAMANPDGRKQAEAGILWRKNTDHDDGCTFSGGWGTDLNRNSSFKWGGVGSSGYACDDTYRGPGPDSEPETRAVQGYMRAIFADQRGPADSDPAAASTTGLMVTLHSYGQLVLWPWGWTEDPAPNVTELQTLGRKLAYFNHYLPQQSVGLYPTTGSTDDWAYGELGVAAFTIEMGTDFFQDCATFENKIYPDNIQALLYAFKTARRPYQNPGGPDSLKLRVHLPSVRAGTQVPVSATADDTRSSSLEPTQAIAAAQLSLDRPGWASPALNLPLAALDGALDETVEELATLVDTTGWEPGRHTLFVQSRDQSGAWGVPGAAFLWIELELDPAQAEQLAAPGETVAYTLSLTNTNLSADSYTVDTSDGLWPASGPVSIGPLEPGESATFTVYVSVPGSAVAGGQEANRVVVTSQTDPQRTAAAVLSTRVRSAGSQFYPAESAGYGPPGTLVEHSLTLANTGSSPDTYDLVLEGGAWERTVSSASLVLEAGARETLTVTVTIPESAALKDSDQTMLKAISHNSPEGSSAVRLSTHAHLNSFRVTPTAAWQVGKPGETAAYTFQVRSTGRLTDTLAVEVLNSAWNTTVLPAALSLAPGQAAGVTLTVTVPLTAPPGAVDTASLRFASLTDPEVALNAVLTTRASGVHRVRTDASRIERTAQPGQKVVFSLWITNAGNETDSFQLQPTGTSWQIDSPEVTQPLSPGAAERVTFEVAVPADAAAGTVTIPIQVISEGDPSQSVPVDLIIQVRWQVFLPLFW